MRLIDADLLDITEITTDDYSGNEVLDVVLKEDIDNAEPVKAIPLEKLEQIREEILNYLDSREKVADDEWVSYEISEMRKYIQDKFKGVSDGRT